MPGAPPCPALSAPFAGCWVSNAAIFRRVSCWAYEELQRFWGALPGVASVAGVRTAGDSATCVAPLCVCSVDRRWSCHGDGAQCGECWCIMQGRR